MDRVDDKYSEEGIGRTASVSSGSAVALGRKQGLRRRSDARIAISRAASAGRSLGSGLAAKAAIAGVLTLLLVAGVAADPGTQAAYPVNLTTTGGVTNAGNQNYHVQGNQLVFGMVEGYPLNPATTRLNYNLNAQVEGLSTTGNANIHLSGTVGSPLSSALSWTCASGPCGTFDSGPSPPPGHGGDGNQPQGCKAQDHDGSTQCQAKFTPSSTGVVALTATYPGDSYNTPSSDSYTLFVGSTTSSLATSVSLVCDQAYLPSGQTTNCRATINTADGSPETGNIAWTSACQPASDCGTFSFGPSHPDGPDGSSPQGCNHADPKGQMQCQAQFAPAAGLDAPVVITATYTPAQSDQHSGSADSYTVFVGSTASSLATSTSLVCDQDRLNPNQDTNCQATIYTAGGDTTITLDANLNMDNQTTEMLNIQGGAGVGIPLGCPATTNCNSFIPGFFAAAGNVQVNIGAGQGGPNDPHSPPSASMTEMTLESPYLNPWGGPILITSADCLETMGASCGIALAATYKLGTIDWSGSQVAGTMTGQLGSGASATAVSGMMTLTTNEHEDLVAGTTSDTGTMNFTGFTSSLSSTPLTLMGKYHGTSVIPSPTAPTDSAAGQACALENAIFGSMQTGFTTPCSNDCSASLGFPGAGVCTETGFQSTGQFNLQSPPLPPAKGQPAQPHFSLKGTYDTTWSVPAIGFVSFVPSGTLSER